MSPAAPQLEVVSVPTEVRTVRAGFVWPSEREPADRVAILCDDRGGRERRA
ncbi:hypothetical protein [Streptomyces sp. Go-475]|uniref:hypothetical protein n=1 Tax=Streptomyces sp. Go-475 TaxID=2072505 RepID=UPI001300B208|nr:hypothetical protein [Streptomyces sp. Go-475]